MGEEAQTDWDAPGYGSVTKDLPWLLALMRQLARRATYPENWPEGYPRWSVHEAEFMLCEFDKYKRKSAGVTSGRKYRLAKAA